MLLVYITFSKYICYTVVASVLSNSLIPFSSSFRSLARVNIIRLPNSVQGQGQPPSMRNISALFFWYSRCVQNIPLFLFMVFFFHCRRHGSRLSVSQLVCLQTSYNINYLSVRFSILFCFLTQPLNLSAKRCIRHILRRRLHAVALQSVCRKLAYETFETQVQRLGKYNTNATCWEQNHFTRAREANKMCSTHGIT